MKRFSIPTQALAQVLAQALVITLVISACGAKETPTANPVDLQSTMLAAASTLVAETQASIPTATPLPPTATLTNTPLPTNTFLPLPTVGPASTPNPGAGDPCINQVLPATLVGDPVKIRINNSTKAAISFSIYLNQTTPQGKCGYRAYTIDPGQSLVLNDLVEGCFTLWAWNPDPDSYFIVTNGTSCIDSSEPSVFDISTSSIKLGT